MYKRLIINILCNFYVSYVPIFFKKKDLFIVYSLLNSEQASLSSYQNDS